MPFWWNLHLDWYRWMHLHVFNSVEIQNLSNTKIIFQDLVSVIGKGFKYGPLKAIFESWKCSMLNKISIEMFQPFEYICATFIVAVFHWNSRKTSNWKRECEWNDILTSLLKLKCQFSGLPSSQDLIENPCQTLIIFFGLGGRALYVPQTYSLKSVLC